MDVKLAGIWEDKFILVHWVMDLKSEENKLSFDEFRNEREKSNIINRVIKLNTLFKQSNMILKFDISNNKLYLNHYEVFKHSFLEESLYMGGKENFIKYIQNYFTDKKIELMLEFLIKSNKTRIKDKKILEKYLLINVKQNESLTKELKIVYRYNLSKEDNFVLQEEIKIMISLLKQKTALVSFGSKEYVDISKRIVTLRDIVNNVKQIEVSKDKVNATLKAREQNRENSIKKIKNAYKNLLDNSRKITIYSISKEAAISYATAKKYREIFEEHLNT